jgi:hypothetical protein
MLSATTSPDAAATADRNGSVLGTTLLLVSEMFPPLPPEPQSGETKIRSEIAAPSVLQIQQCKIDETHGNTDHAFQ